MSQMYIADLNFNNNLSELNGARQKQVKGGAEDSGDTSLLVQGALELYKREDYELRYVNGQPPIDGTAGSPAALQFYVYGCSECAGLTVPLK